jgi:hypothetical protein
VSRTSTANALATGSTLADLLDHARRAHESVRTEPSAALLSAMEAGDALLAAKAQVKRGEWAPRLASTGIPPSTARLYMQLAANRERIIASGAESIREARRLLADAKPKRPRAARAQRDAPPVSDRYDEGYKDGYRAGRADATLDGWLAGAARTRAPGPLAERDLKWLIRLAHPDVHNDKAALKATRTTAWLTAQLDQARKRGEA